MSEIYEKTTKNIEKLRVNEAKMTEEQKKQYEKPLNKLRKEIFYGVSEIVSDFLTAGMLPAKSEADHISDSWKEAICMRKKIIKESEGVIKKAMELAVKNYSLDECVKAVLPVRIRIWYQAYGPYWLKHCTPTFKDEFTFTNDIIGMEWWEGHNEWVTVKYEDWKKVVDYQGGVTIMLPPTAELLETVYKREMGAVSA